MRNMLIILLLIVGTCQAHAQSKHNIYVDLAVTNQGFSATYTRKLTRHSDIGGGISSFNFRHASYGNSRSAVYLDLRRYWGTRKSLFFVFTNIGLAINGGQQPYLATMSPLGVHAALGSGYFYRINKKGMGPYLSLGIYGNSSTIRYKYPPPPPRSRESAYVDAGSVISVGFKF